MEQIVIGNVGAPVEHELVGVYDSAFPDDEHMYARYRFLAEKAYDVGI